MGTEFALLGDVQARVDGQPVDLGHARQRSVVVALLVDANQAVSTDQLIERVWADGAPQRARDTLYGYLHRLRRVLNATKDVQITRQSGGYLLAVDPLAVDLHRFRDLAAQARAGTDDPTCLRQWQQALALWRGEAFAGMDTPWINGVRDALDRERLAAELDCTDIRLRQGQHAELLAELSARAAEHPLDERVAAQLLLALHRAGRQAEALAAFQTIRRLLVTELGIEPGPQLQQLHAQILRGDAERPIDDVGTDDALREGELGPLDRAAREVASAVEKQWKAEAQLRSLHRPEPARLTWSSADRLVTPVRSVPLTLRGDITTMVDTFRQLPVRQLVVLGEAGAGKTVTAVLFTLGLLATPEPGEPTPVLFSLASWDPDHEHLHAWLINRLLEEHPGLVNVAAYGRDAAARLVLEGRILPVLDGLDEIPSTQLATAIDALDEAMGGDRQIVLTCRSADYEKAVHHGGTALARASVVEIESVGVEDAIAFLTARQPAGEQRWQSVVAHLRECGEGRLAAAMSTPLMLDLARTAYSRPGAEPAELLEPALFPDRAAIEEHLLDEFLPTAYPHRPPPSTPDVRSTASGRYGAAQARQWLTFMAGHLKRRNTHDLAWWQLVSAVSPTARGLLCGLPAALLFAITGLLVAGPRMALVYGISTALAGCLANALGTRPQPLRVEMRFRGTTRGFLGRFAIGVGFGLAIGFAWSLPAGVVLVLAVVFGAAIALHVWLTAPSEANQVFSPATVWAQDRMATLAFALSAAVPLGLFYAVTISVSGEPSGVGTVDNAFYLARALPAGVVSAVFGWFAFKRVGAVSYGLAGAVVGGQVMPHHISTPFAIAAGTLFGLAIGLIAATCRPWGATVLAAFWLALRGRTPLRLMAFLDDAHRRGVLRQAGAVHQFRHARLRDRLAGGDAPAR